MRMKVICAVLVYNGPVYHRGDYVEIEIEKDRQRMVKGGSVVEAPVPEIREEPRSHKKTHNRRKN